MPDRSGELLLVNIIFMTLTTAVTGLRVYCRGWVIRSFGIDDKLMLGTWIIFMGYLTAQLLGVRYGTGKSRDLLDDRSNRNALMWWFVCELFYIVCTCMLKVSVGFFLLRISVDLKHVWILRVSMMLTIIFGLSYFFIAVFQCLPVSIFWEIDPRAEGYCMAEKPIIIMTYTASCLNCIADWIFGIMPAFIVWSLKMPLKTRILVIALLSFAAVGSSATIVRSKFIPTLTNGADFLFATTDVAIWSTVEPGVGISAASMATLKPLIQLISYKVGLSDTGPSNSYWQERHRGRRGHSSYVRSSSAPSIQIHNLRLETTHQENDTQ